LAIFPDVVESSGNLASDAAGVAGHTAPKSPDARIPAPDLTPADVGEVEETCPQVVADAPSQLIREIRNRVSYPHASKTTSRANPGVAEKCTTPACARQAVGQGNGCARKKATQGGVSKKGIYIYNTDYLYCYLTRGKPKVNSQCCVPKESAGTI